MHRYGFPILALAVAGSVGAPALEAQTRVEREAFTWAGKIPDGRWINVRNMNGTIEVERATGDRVEVVATRHTKRGNPEFVRFEVRKFGTNEQDVLVCAL